LKDSVEEELDRVLPLVTSHLKNKLSRGSIANDLWKHAVAEEALKRGCSNGLIAWAVFLLIKISPEVLSGSWL